MDHKTKKSQVVLAALDQQRQSVVFLLLQTNQRRGEFWQNVTGKVEDGESFEEGALREAIEETGLKIESIVDIIDLNIIHEFTDQRGRKVEEKSFLIILDHSWDVKLDPKEHMSCKWVELKDIKTDSVKYQGNFEALAKSIQLLQQWGH
jgi:lipoyl(octanoyl) transferase